MTARIRSVDYAHDGQSLRAQLTWDDDWTEPRPCVVVVHDAMRSDQGFEEERAAILTGEGYAGFALDVYGAGVQGRNEAEAGALMAPFMADRGFLQRRLRAGLVAAAELPEVDAARMAVIGYCFGGLCALDLARANAPVVGVASFHGLLAPPEPPLADPADAPIAPRVIAFHGWDDAWVPPDTVAPFAAEMTARDADWQLVAYGGTGHAFTNVRYDATGDGVGYSPRADARSWRALLDLLAELFPGATTRAVHPAPGAAPV